MSLWACPTTGRAADDVGGAGYTRLIAAVPEPLLPLAQSLPSPDLPDPEACEDARLLRQGALAITAAFWLYAVGVSAARAMLDHEERLGALLLMRVAVALVGCGFCYLIHLALVRAERRPFYQQALLVVAVTPFFADALAWINFLGTRIVIPSTPTTYKTSETILGVVYWVWFFIAWSALYMALRYSFQVRAQDRRVRASQALSHAAQLRALRNQISPHFLFNTLNAISALILEGRNAAAEAMVTRVSEFFRTSLTVDPLDDIRLADELALQRLYLDIEQVRFPDLTVEMAVPDDLADALVPTLILQPLVENAVKYAIARSPSPATIRIDAAAAGTRLRLSVADDGAAVPSSSGAGIGLHNVRDRLATRFGADHAFSAGPRRPRGFLVVLELPLRRS